MADNILFKADVSSNIIFKTLLLKGEAGNNIVSVEKTATSGLVDTYTITLTDGTTTTFNVTNGKSIVSIELTSSTGNTDTYTITYNDNTTQTYNVTNGKEITIVEKTATNVLVDTYTITYNDGTTSTFNVTNGKGITGIAKTATVGRVDTYTISYNDGTTSTFDVTNGIDYTVPTGGIIAYDGNDTPAGYEDSSVTAFTANMIGFTPPTGMSATDTQNAIVELKNITSVRQSITTSYTENPYVSATSFGRSYVNEIIKDGLWFLQFNVNVDLANIPTNTAVEIGTITVPTGKRLWDYSVSVPCQDNSTTYGNVIVTVAQDGKITIGNYSGKPCRYWYRCIMPLFFI